MSWFVLVLVATMPLGISLVRFFRRVGANVAGEERFIAAQVETALSTVPWGTRVPLAPTVREVLDVLGCMPPRIRRLFRLGMWLLELAPWLTCIAPSTWSGLDVPSRRRVLARLDHPPFGSLGELQAGVHAMVLTVLGGRPEVLEVVGVDRQSWIASRRSARALALRGES